MKFKKKKIEPNLSALNDLIQNYNPPPKLISAAIRNKKKFSDEKEEIDHLKSELIKKHAVITEMGNVQTKTDENGDRTNEIKFKSDYDREIYTEIMNSEYEDPVNLDVQTVDLEKVQEFEMPSNLVFQLRWMFE